MTDALDPAEGRRLRQAGLERWQAVAMLKKLRDRSGGSAKLAALLGVTEATIVGNIAGTVAFGPTVLGRLDFADQPVSAAVPDVPTHSQLLAERARRLHTAFREAGAPAEDFARLDQLIETKRAEIGAAAAGIVRAPPQPLPEAFAEVGPLLMKIEQALAAQVAEGLADFCRRQRRQARLLRRVAARKSK